MIPSRRPGRRARGFLTLFGTFCFCATVHLAGCGRDFQNPFLPESDSYAGSAWSRDADRDGIADSVEKYAPGCAAEPSECLRKAQTNAGLQPRPIPHIPVEGIRAADLALAPGESRLPDIVIEPADATDPRYELLTHDPAVAFIRQGMVVGAAAGRTMITARTLDGNHEARFQAVVHRKVEAISARPLTLMADAKPQAPSLEFHPPDATDRGYTLSGGDANVAVITVDGKIQPMGPGTTRMTATVEGGLKVEFTVTVEAPVIPVESVKVQNMDIVLLAETDDRIREPAIAWTPANATNKGYSMTSGNPSVVRVVGGSVEVLKPGEAKITLLTDDGRKKANFKVKVTILIPCGVLYPCEDDD